MQTKFSAKMLSLLLILAVSVGVLAGCTGGGTASTASPADSSVAASTPAESTPAPAAGDVAIRVAWWGNQVRNDGTTKMLSAFMEENPGVTIESEFTDWSGYWDKLATQAASNNLPNIIQQDYAYIAQYQAKDQLANLSEQVTAGNLNIDDVSESILATGSFNGDLYALCAGVNAVCLIYDKTVLDEAGVTVPARPTYQELMDISADVFAKTGVRGETPAGNGSLIMMSREVGEVYFDVANKKIGSSEATVLKYFTQVKDTITSDWSVSVDVLQEATTSGVENQPLPTGKSWTNYPGGSNQLSAFQSATENELALAFYPTSAGATQENMYLRPSQFWSITQASENKDVSAQIINYFTNSEKAQDILQAERGVPVSGKMAAYLEPQLDEVQQLVFAYIAEVTKVAVPFDPPQPVGANEVNKLLDDLTDLVRYGELTPEAATARLIPEANDILAKATE